MPQLEEVVQSMTQLEARSVRLQRVDRHSESSASIGLQNHQAAKDHWKPYL